MNDDKGSPFDKMFRDMFGPSHRDGFEDFTRQMEEMMEQINTMFSNPGEVDVSIGYHPQPGDRHPAYKQSPRDAMLKDPNEPVENSALSKDMTPSPITQNKPEPFIFSGHFRIPPLFGPPHMPGLFGSPSQQGDTVLDDDSPGCEGCQENVSWSSSNSFSSQMFGQGSGWSGTQIRTIQHPDGSVERIEKKTENGRTCTTVTRTDPSGVTSSTTTCDRPAIGNSPGLESTDPSLNPTSSKFTQPTLPVDRDMKPDDTSFFSKLFGFKFFKPRDE